MNFFGHAVVASWKRPAPAFVLGSMLPDFASMVGSRIAEIGDSELAEGVVFHHATDRVFHGTAVFRELSGNATIQLGQLGLARGSARAAAHVGVEILLDGVLARDTDACGVYRRALELAGREPPFIRLADAAAGVRLGELQRLLLCRGIAACDVAPLQVGQRVARTLESRPRLALDAAGQRGVERWAERSLPAVEAAAPALIEELALGLLLSQRSHPG